MGFHILSNRGQSANRMMLPSAYRTNVSWRPQLGDIFPDFSAHSTQGLIQFHNWAEGDWTFLFSHSAAFCPVCTSEISDVVRAHDALTKRGVKPMSISGDQLSDLSLWSVEVAKTIGKAVAFPIVADPDHVVTRAAGMKHPKEIDGHAIRKSFLIDPSLRIRMIFEYPVCVGRSMDETLRVIDALLVVAEGDVATPGGWRPGDPVLQLRAADPGFDPLADADLPWTELSSYLKVREG